MSVIRCHEMLQLCSPNGLVQFNNDCAQNMPSCNMRFPAYGGKTSCNAVILLCNSIRREVADIIKVISRISPDRNSLNLEMIRDLFQWLQKSSCYLTTLLDILFDEVLNEPLVMSIMDSKTMIAKNFTFWKGSMKFALCAILDCEKMFNIHLPAGERFGKVADRCTGLQIVVDHTDIIFNSMKSAMRLSSKHRRKYKSLERHIWYNAILKADDAGMSLRDGLRGILTRWMSTTELQKFAKQLHLPKLIQIRKFNKIQKLFDKTHGHIPRNIDQMMQDVKQAGLEYSALAGGDHATWSHLIQLSRNRALSYAEALAANDSANDNFSDGSQRGNDEDAFMSVISYVTD